MLITLLRSVKREAVTNLLEVIGLTLLVVAAGMVLGPAAAVASAGLALLGVSFALTRAERR